jgi:hypothetical protein
MAPGKPSGYLSYLIRLWQVDSGQGGAGGTAKVWRGSLESSLSSGRLGFANLDDLFDFLRLEVTVEPDSEGEQS